MCEKMSYMFFPVIKTSCLFLCVKKSIPEWSFHLSILTCALLKKLMEVTNQLSNTQLFPLLVLWTNILFLLFFIFLFFLFYFRI